MPLRLLVPFLEGSVRRVVEQARNAAVVRSLRRSENLGVREDLVKSKQRYAVSGMAAASICCAEPYAFTCNAGYEVLTQLGWLNLEHCPDDLAMHRV